MATGFSGLVTCDAGVASRVVYLDAGELQSAVVVLQGDVGIRGQRSSLLHPGQGWVWGPVGDAHQGNRAPSNQRHIVGTACSV